MTETQHKQTITAPIEMSLLLCNGEESLSGFVKGRSLR